jgi:hypothetical protein
MACVDLADAEEVATGVDDKGTIGGDVDAATVVVVGETGLLAGSGFTISILVWGDAEAASTGDIDPSTLTSMGVVATALRPKNDNKPALVFFALVALAVCVAVSLSVSSTRQPTGKSSWTTSGRDLMDVSHAVEPFEAMSCDIGLSRVSGTCLLSRIHSAMDLAVNDLPKGTIGGRVISSGATRFIRESLSTSSEHGIASPSV